MSYSARTTSYQAPPEVEAGVKAIKKRLRWPSMHWGVESVHPDAWPHIAAAVLDSQQPPRPSPIEFYVGLWSGVLVSMASLFIAAWFLS